VIRLVDKDADGKPDQITTFAKIDNPRGITVLGDQVIVLHTVTKNGKYDNQQLSVFEDKDWNGIADGPPVPLVKNIGNSKFIQRRGVDHSTNNIRFAIDGWLYLSIGDFGMLNAEGTDGRQLTMFGGIARVRPDGSGLEEYTSGTRNVYDVAIDGRMNIFTRENTNDGIGWWARSSHFIQSANYGYPSLYTNFPTDMLPAMAEYGAGSGTGALFLEEPQWKGEFHNTALLADWGHSMIYSHELQPLGATFTNRSKPFLGVSQIADLDIDASGRMYVAAWDGAGYQGNPSKGYVDLILPKGWKYKPFPKLKSLNDSELTELLTLESLTARNAASYELVARKSKVSLIPMIKDSNLSIETRIAAIYTHSQLHQDTSNLITIAGEDVIVEHIIRAMTDDLAIAKKANFDFISSHLNNKNPRVQAAAIIALGRMKKFSPRLLALASPGPVYKSPPVPKPVYTSEALNSLEQAVNIKVDVSKMEKLVLIVDEIEHNKNDHAAWLNPTITFKNGKRVNLTTLTPKSVSTDFGELEINKDYVGNPLKYKGKLQKGLGVHGRAEVVYLLPKDAQTFTAKGVLTPGAIQEKNSGKLRFVITDTPSKPVEKKGYIAPTVLKAHSTPLEGQVIPHLAQKTLKKLWAVKKIAATIKTADGESYSGALEAAKFIHSEEIVNALIYQAKESNGVKKEKIMDVLARLHQKQKPNDGVNWWGTRPNPDGPYITPIDWNGTKLIDEFFTSLDEVSERTLDSLKRNKAYVPELNPRPIINKNEKAKKIKDTSIEDIVIHINQYKGKINNGKKVIGTVGCAGCHNIDNTSVVRSPDLTILGKMSNTDLVEAIIKPGATIAPSWIELTLKDNSKAIGTIVKETKTELTLHDLVGTATTYKTSEIDKRALGLNMMSPNLCDELTLNEFGDLISYIKSLDKR